MTTSEAIATLARETAAKGVSHALAAADDKTDAVEWAQTLIRELEPFIASALASVAESARADERHKTLEEVECALREFDGLTCQGVECGPPLARAGGIVTVVDRSDAMHVLLHLRARLRDLPPLPQTGEGQ